MLDRFSKAKAEEILRLKDLKHNGTFPAPWPGKRPSLEKVLRTQGPGAVIAEYKRASPSHGEINLKLGPREIGQAYKAGGASALSVLTEEKFFKGSVEYLFQLHDLGLTLLRKDFIIHPLQVEQTAATPASALLLIVRMFSDPVRLEELHRLALTFGLEAVFEIFTPEELKIAREAGARIIQVNNRDLSTLKVDLALSEKLIGKKKKHEVWISASGISKPEQVKKLRQLGFEGLLIGASLMGSSDPGKLLGALVGTLER
ncbi:MAG: indole-3-glycerol-phosphate synthase [Desulfovibrionales bacterium]